MSRMRARAGRREDGSALIAVIMMMMVISVIALGVTQTARHSNDVTSVDRERLQTIQSAEAGVNDAIRRIQGGAGCDAAVSPFADLKDLDKVVGRYRTRIVPEAGTTCGQTPRRVIQSWGYAPTGGTRAMRHLEVTVQLVPLAGFPYTLFAEGTSGTIFVKNTGTVVGDAYAETFDQTKNNLTSQSIVSPGSIVTKNNASYSGTMWAGGNITLNNNSAVGQSVIASGTFSGTQGEITMADGVVIGGDAVAKGAITLNGAIVNGAVSQNNTNTPAPPNLVKPTFTWNVANYAPVVPTQGTAAQITTALNTNKNSLQGVYRSTDGAGTITLPSSATVTGPLTIVSSGKVSVGKTLLASGGPWQVTVVAQSSAADAISPSQAFTAASGLDVLFFTVGGFDMKNNVSFTGAIYADLIDAKNTFAIGHSISLQTNPPVGFTFDLTSTPAFNAVPTLWREVAPGAPPA
jgi:type IV pilus assembly PilX-like protein